MYMLLVSFTLAIFDYRFFNEGGGVNFYGGFFSHQPWLLLWCGLRWVGARMEIADISALVDLSYGIFRGKP